MYEKKIFLEAVSHNTSVFTLICQFQPANDETHILLKKSYNQLIIYGVYDGRAIATSRLLSTQFTHKI